MYVLRCKLLALLDGVTRRKALLDQKAFMMKDRIRLLTLALVALSLGACESPEAQKKQRQQKLTEFVTTVVKQLLDRNPKTFQDSMDQLMREGGELDDAAVHKLESQNQLPDSPIEIAQVISRAQAKHNSNTITISSTTPLDPITKDVVRFKINGKDTRLVDGHPQDDRPFEVTITAKLTPEMDGYARVLDISGLPASVGLEAEGKPDSKAPGPAQSKKHRKH